MGRCVLGRRRSFRLPAPLGGLHLSASVAVRSARGRQTALGRRCTGGDRLTVPHATPRWCGAGAVGHGATTVATEGSLCLVATTTLGRSAGEVAAKRGTTPLPPKTLPAAWWGTGVATTCASLGGEAAWAWGRCGR